MHIQVSIMHMNVKHLLLNDFWRWGGNLNPQVHSITFHLIFSITESIKRRTRKLSSRHAILKWDRPHRFPSICVVYQSFTRFTFRMTSRQVFHSHCNTCAFVEIHIKYSYLQHTQQAAKIYTDAPYRLLHSVLTRNNSIHMRKKALI